MASEGVPLGPKRCRASAAEVGQNPEPPRTPTSGRRSPAFVADVVQELKTKLFVEKKLLQYAGRGPLGGSERMSVVPSRP